MAKYASFNEFYADYLAEHANRLNRRLHFVGSTLALIALTYALAAWVAWPLSVAVIVGYGCAWLGHFLCEKNTPATWTHPLYSLMADWVMYKDMLAGRIRW